MFKRNYRYLILLFFITLMISFYSCDKGTEVPFSGDNNQLGNGIVRDFTTTTGGILRSTNGFAIEVVPGAVPRQSNNSIGTVTFSIEENVPFGPNATTLPIS